MCSLSFDKRLASASPGDLQGRGRSHQRFDMEQDERGNMLRNSADPTGLTGNTLELEEGQEMTDGER